MKSETLRDYGVYTFIDDAVPGVWVAACARPYMVSQGATEAEAVQSFLECLAYQVLFDTHAGRDLYEIKPGSESEQQWAAKHEKCHTK